MESGREPLQEMLPEAQLPPSQDPNPSFDNFLGGAPLVPRPRQTPALAWPGSRSAGNTARAKKQALERAQRDADYNPAADPDFQESMVLDTQTARARGVPQYVPSGRAPATRSTPALQMPLQPVASPLARAARQQRSQRNDGSADHIGAQLDAARAVMSTPGAQSQFTAASAAGDAQLTPHGVQLAVSRLTNAVESLINLVQRNGKTQQEMATAVLAALTKLGAAPAGDVKSLRSRTQHLSPLATALFRVSIWATNEEVISDLLTVYYYALGLDATAQQELPEETHSDLIKMVRDFLGKQGRQACKTEIEKAAKVAFLKTYPDRIETGELDKSAIGSLLRTGLYRDSGDMLFAADEFQEIALKHYAHITHQKGAWNPEKDNILLAPRELAYVDLCVRAFLKKVSVSAPTAAPPKRKGGSGTTDTMWANGTALAELLASYALPVKDEEADLLSFNIKPIDVTWQTIYQHCGGQLPNQAAAEGTPMAIEGAAAQPEAA